MKLEKRVEELEKKIRKMEILSLLESGYRNMDAANIWLAKEMLKELEDEDAQIPQNSNDLQTRP